MKKVLISWIGIQDLKAAGQTALSGLGPVGQAVKERNYDEIAILCDFSLERSQGYIKWLKNQTNVQIRLYPHTLSSPTHFGEIYKASADTVTKVLKQHSSADLTFHLSPGTPTMAAIWVILAKTRFPAELIESSQQHGVKTASVPFDISAEFIPDLLRKPDQRLEQASAESPPSAPEFSDIVHRCSAMSRIIAKARRIAPRSVPVLIEGESGVGKELLARAIHKASPRYDKPFVAVNCGAIPNELVESTLFGHEKNAFTGATRMHKGYFETADKGTLLLDEIGELPLPAQVKILRTLQEKEIVRVGATKPIKINVRIIAATNRNLVEEIQGNRFRADLFYRLAVAVFYLPPLRDRQGDLTLLIDNLLSKVNAVSREEPGYVHKIFSVSAKNLLIQHHWPGNVRELLNTIRRAALWSEGAVIENEDICDAIIPITMSEPASILNRPLGQGLSLPVIIQTVTRHYIERALDQTHGNKTQAAELVGLPSYQTLTNWMKRYGIEKL